ncbi:hypothetical protein SAMN05518682_2443 [Cellulosimicrobium aquatile]|uniref:Uncharacterized protein n=1 Tax=Cellulosimicrobium aquatile TaxID=1612203 RepID=A0A1N6SPN5_9MICO|nr:hypothetical protein [Cellulosimicrobium aquatile]SIQ43004.1 hypothetical protein SAMN05518682_2443 [Cellulosimicrobium aquatile]
MNDENRRDDDTRPLGDELFDPAPAQGPEPAQQQERREASGTDATVPLPAVTPAADARATTPLPAAAPSTDTGATTPLPAMPPADPLSVDGPPADAPPVGARSAGAPSTGAPLYGAAPTASGADPSSTGGAPGAGADPGPLPRRGPRVATIVWGFVIVAFAVVVLAAALGARVDLGLATIVVLAAAGVTLVVGSIVSGARRRRG